MEKNVFYFFYKITCRKLKCQNRLSLSKREFSILLMMACAICHIMARSFRIFVANQSSHFSKCYLIKVNIMLVNNTIVGGNPKALFWWLPAYHPEVL